MSAEDTPTFNRPLAEKTARSAAHITEMLAQRMAMVQAPKMDDRKTVIQPDGMKLELTNISTEYGDHIATSELHMRKEGGMLLTTARSAFIDVVLTKGGESIVRGGYSSTEDVDSVRYKEGGVTQLDTRSSAYPSDQEARSNLAKAALQMRDHIDRAGTIAATQLSNKLGK